MGNLHDRIPTRGIQNPIPTKVVNPDGSPIGSTAPTGTATSSNQTDGSQKTQIVDTTNTVITPAQDDTLILLRRIVKLLESNAVVDINNRQKVVVDSVTANSLTTAGWNTGLVGNIVTIGAPTLGTIAPLPIWEGPVDQRFRIMDAARLTYNQGIRSHLSFT